MEKVRLRLSWKKWGIVLQGSDFEEGTKLKTIVYLPISINQDSDATKEMNNNLQNDSCHLRP